VALPSTGLQKNPIAVVIVAQSLVVIAEITEMRGFSPQTLCRSCASGVQSTTARMETLHGLARRTQNEVVQSWWDSLVFT
jgi:hypothetical protein